MKKHLLRLLFFAITLVFGTNALADTGSATVKMTWVDYNAPTESKGEIATGETARAGFNKIADGAVGFGNTGWGENKIAYLQVDASAFEGTITGATLMLDVSGSSDSKRQTAWGVGYNSSDWSASMTYETADKSITLLGGTQSTSTKSASTFETKSFDIKDAFKNDADKIVTILVYETAAAGGYIKNPTVTIEYTNAAVANYTVKFMCGETEIKDAATRSGIVGDKAALETGDDTAVYANNKKYIYTGNNIVDVTIANDGSSVIIVNFREAAIYNYSLLSSLGSTIASGTGFEGDNAKVGYPHYAIAEGIFYEAAANDRVYAKDIALTADNASETITYTAKDGVSAIFFAEGENIDGMTVSTAGNVPIRASNAKAGVSSEDITITTLAAGKYILHVGAFTSKTSAQTIYVGYGETQIAFASSSNLNESASDEITLTKETAIKYFGTTSSTDAQFDYIWIEKTGDVSNDYTSYIINADLKGEGGFDATETKGIDGSGIVKVSSGKIIDFKQTIANLPAGKYKLTAQAAYRYSGSEADEAAAIAAGTETKLAKLYATVGTKTVNTPVQNRYDGASETDYANGNGSTTVNGKYVPNSSAAVQAWFNAGQYVNEVIFNLPEDGNVTIGIVKTAQPEASDYVVIGPWTLTRLGDAETEPQFDPSTIIVNADFEGEYSVFNNPKDDRAIYQPSGWTVAYDNGDTNDMTALNSNCLAWNNFENKPQLENGGNTYWVRFRWGNSEKLMLSQNVILPAGYYRLSADAIFNGANGGSASISAAGISTSITGNNTWSNYKVDFALKEETTVTIAFNLIQTEQVENIAAVDNFKLITYEPLADAKATLQAEIETAETLKATEGYTTEVETFAAAIETAKTSLNSATTLEELTNAIATLKAAEASFTKANLIATNAKKVEGASITNPVASPFVVNGTFNEDTNGWTCTGGFQNKGTATNQQGDFTDKFWENWNPDAKINKMYQSIENIPNGIYKLNIAAFVNNLADPNESQYVFANSDKVFLSVGAPTMYEVFTKVENNTIEVGLEQTTATANWMGIDNISLTYFGTEGTIEQAKDAAIIKELADLRAEATSLKEKVGIASITTTIDNALTATADVTGTEAIKAAIETMKAVIKEAQVFAKAKDTLVNMKKLVESTNVYTAEALNDYYTQWEAKYNDGTITKEEAVALQDPFLGTEWHAAITCDNFLLSAWDTNPDFQDAPYYINTWSTEGNNDGSNFTVPFFEYWTGDANSLGEKTLTATMTNLPAGDYDITALVRVRMKNDAEAPATGITLQVNNGEAVNVAVGDQIGESQFFMKEFTATGSVAEDGVLKIKFNVAAENNISWLSFKNVKFEKQIVLTPVMTLKGTIGEEVSLTFGVYDSEDTFSVDFGDGQLQSAKVGINNAGPVKEDGNTAAATVFTGKVAGDGTITVYGKNDIWYLVANGAMPTTFDQAKLMNVVQMTISSANVETVELPAYEKMTQFSFTNSPVKSVDVSKVVGLTRIDIFNTTQSAYEPQLESIDVSKNVNLETIVLGGNTYKKGQITALDFTNNTKLNQISAENNKIVSVTNIPVSVKNIYLSNNELASLTFPEFTAKGTIQIQNNKFTLATLPTKPAITTASKYTYAPQPAYAVAESVAELDLSSQLTATGILTEPATTTYSFVTTSGTALVEGTDYEVTEPGKFKFLTAQTEKVHGVMTNEAFPKFTGANAYVTTEFTVMEPVKPIEGISYSWESPAGTPIQWGGTIAYVNGEGDRLNYQNSGFYTICLNGKKANINDETASANAGKMVITLDKALAEGDTIAYTAYINKNQSKNASAYILFENGTDAEGEVFGDEANIDATFNGVPTLKYTVVPAEAAGSKTITLTRSQTGTNLFITKLQVIEKKAEPVQTELAQELNVERYPGLGYGVTEATVDFTEAKAFLGVEEITTDMLRIVNPDGTMISDYAPYDGWFNGEGAAETWGSNTKVCVKFFQAIPEGSYQICDMNGADEVGKTYTVKWALEANDKKVTYTINVKFIEKPVITLTFADLNKVDEQTVALTSELGKCYEGMTADVNVAAILAKLGVESLSDVTIYAVQSNGTLDDNYKVGNTDGWRNATGDWQTWGADAYFYVKANFALESAQLYEVGGMDGKNTTDPVTYTATYAFVKTGTADAIVLKVTLTYAVPTGINAINRDAQNTDIYNVNGQKMNKAQKGLNIINGKKVVIK